jgi:hypothetical protein
MWAAVVVVEAPEDWDWSEIRRHRRHLLSTRR